MFEIKPSNFLGAKHGCPKCAVAKSNKITEEEFLKKAYAKFGDKFGYFLTSYIGYDSRWL